jgi:HTH-type transcriptional regulator/antitoxin HigA
LHAQRNDHDLAVAFVREASRGRQMLALHKHHIRAGSKQDEHALLAWKARVLWKARRLDVVRRHRAALDMTVVRRLVDFSQREDGPPNAVALLRQHGVAVVFEEHLPHTHLDGAAMLLDDTVPVIGMTLRYNRLDNFWFVLLHECAHVLLHADRGLRDGFFDDEKAPAQEVVEQEADEYARNALIPSELWKGSFVRFTASSEQVIEFARKNKVGVSVVAGRIQRERDDYTLFPDLVGQGEPKKLISAAGYWE